ncbi:MAG: BolA family transcriptional regulator [Deltaproteobacteria bacterium]|nr:BolA family transcriptional regulator [Deltaproteobacteria bacterium]
MSMAETIERLLRRQLAVDRLEILDDGWRHAGHAEARGGGHFTVTIVSPDFTGKARIERHRMVYAALGDQMRQAIHALVLITRAPDEVGPG